MKLTIEEAQGLIAKLQEAIDEAKKTKKESQFPLMGWSDFRTYTPLEWFYIQPPTKVKRKSRGE